MLTSSLIKKTRSKNLFIYTVGTCQIKNLKYARTIRCVKLKFRQVCGCQVNEQMQVCRFTGIQCLEIFNIRTIYP